MILNRKLILFGIPFRHSRYFTYNPYNTLKTFRTLKLNCFVK